MPSLQKKQAQFRSVPPSEHSGYFIQVPIEIIKNQGLSPAGLKLYLLLLAYCGPKSWAWPSQNRLAGEMGLTERRVRSLLKELEEVGLVAVSRDQGTTNTYYLTASAGEKPRGEKAENKFRGERKKISGNIHELKHVCEDIAGGEGLVEKTEKAEPEKDDRITQHRVGGTEPGEIEELLEQAGLAPLIAGELARLVSSRNRDVSYVKSVIQASREPGVNNPPGFIRFMLLRNAEPRAVGNAAGRVKRPGRRAGSPAPLDFSKYTTGKYAFLSRRPATECPEPATGTANAITTPLLVLTRDEPEPFQPEITGEPAKSEPFSSPAELWSRLRSELRLGGLVPQSVLQYARLKTGPEGEGYILDLPVWAGLSAGQERVIRDKLTALARPGV